MTQSLKLFNTRTRTLELLTSRTPGRVGLYSCGPTVYNFAHIGNLRAYVFVDTLKRTLQWCGYQVEHVMNITDVGHLTDDASDGEDKMELAATRGGRDIWELSRYYASAFFEHCGDLGILPPGIVCRATDHIPQQIALIRRIEERGYAYRINDGLYLDTGKLAHYADFAKLDLSGQNSGARVEVVAGKRQPSDFALWKFAGEKRRQMEWDSPWGRGFPGWHLECSAMAAHYLGERFDIHTGGIDHIPVHHTNEIAQMEAATGERNGINVWMHNNFLVMDDSQKMSKSADGFLTLDVLRGWGAHPLAYRYLLLGAHYRKEAKFSRANLDQAGAALARLWREIAPIKEAARGNKGNRRAEALRAHTSEFVEAMTDDLNTPRALASIWGVVRDETLDAADKMAFLDDVDQVVGLRLLNAPPAASSSIVNDERMQKVIAARKDARANKDFAKADAIRDVCGALGIQLKDGPEGTTWQVDG